LQCIGLLETDLSFKRSRANAIGLMTLEEDEALLFHFKIIDKAAFIGQEDMEMVYCLLDLNIKLNESFIFDLGTALHEFGYF